MAGDFATDRNKIRSDCDAYLNQKWSDQALRITYDAPKFTLAMAPLAGAMCDITGFFRLYLGLGLASPLMYLSGYFLLRHCRKVPRQS